MAAEYLAPCHGPGQSRRVNRWPCMLLAVESQYAMPCQLFFRSVEEKAGSLIWGTAGRRQDLSVGELENGGSVSSGINRFESALWGYGVCEG